MTQTKSIAEQATIQGFLNCYLRETGNYEEVDIQSYKQFLNIKTKLEKIIKVKLKNLDIEFLIPINYWSPTGRHIFSSSLFYTKKGESTLIMLDYLTLSSLIIKELLVETNRADSEDELIMRILLSCKNIQLYIEKYMEQLDDINSQDELIMDFIESEQSLLIGHLLHPTPKSRQGITDEEQLIYSPELKGKFQLHYFYAHSSIIKQDSSLQKSAGELIEQQVLTEKYVSPEFKQKYCQESSYILLPAHPMQVKVLLKKKQIIKLIERGLLIYIGPQGEYYKPTSSVRTVYNSKLDYMYKFSIPLKITNSLRVNKQKELDRGVEIDRLLKTQLGKNLRDCYSKFNIIRDPAYITIPGEKGESGFEVVIRENPFKEEKAKNTTLVAGLCQQDALNGKSPLSLIIHDLACKTKATTEEISIRWFKKYLSISLEPLIWLYTNYGVALEAHQQNSIIKIKDGYPDSFYYRDNQGYYFCKSKASILRKLLPNISTKSDTICEDNVADERFKYYFFINNLFGLINAFGVAGLIDEKKLLYLLRSEIKEININYKHSSKLLTSLLNEKKLSCKANLLTRFYDMDELEGSLEEQSIYVSIDNPLYQQEMVLTDV